MTTEPRPRVLLVDDHPLVVQGLAGLLQDEGFTVVGQAPDCERALVLLSQADVDLVVVDLSLEQGSGYDLLARLNPGPVALVYSVHEDGDHVRRALEAGAMGYVTKREDPEVLVQCLREVLTGNRVLSPRAARAMANAVARGPAHTPEEVLSPQELQVYRLVGRGYGTQEIGREMDLSVRTVETYYGRILLKLDLPGRRELRRHAADSALRRSGDPA